MYNCNGVCTIDFRNVTYYSEIHKIIKEALDFPDYYGENWDAFWDCIVDFMLDDRTIHIEILGLDIVESRFGEKVPRMMIQMMRDAKHYSNDKYAQYKKIEIVDGDRRIEIE